MKLTDVEDYPTEQPSQQPEPSRFWFGVLCALCCSLAFQDYFGLEGYIEILRKHWLSLPSWFYIVWILGAIFCFKNRK